MHIKRLNHIAAVAVGLIVPVMCDQAVGADNAPTPLAMKLSLDSSSVRPGRSVPVECIASVQGHDSVAMVHTYVDKIGYWNESTQGFACAQFPDVAVSTYSTAVPGNPLVKTKQTPGGVSLAFSHPPMRVGVYILRVEAVFGSQKKITSQPCILSVRPLPDADGRIRVPPEWLDPPLKENEYRPPFRRGQVQDIASVSEATSRVGSEIRINSSREIDCIDAMAIYTFSLEADSLVPMDLPLPVDVTAVLGLKMGPRTAKGAQPPR